MTVTAEPHKLPGASDVREIAARLGIRPAKRFGQNFVIDPGTLRRIVTIAAVQPDDYVLEVGPGLGSLTLALLPAARRVLAIEIDPVLAGELPRTVAAMAPGLAGRLEVITADAARVGELPGEPTALVANLPYNAAVPVLLHLLATVGSLARGVVMVQAEAADRMTAQPGSRIYGVPSVKLAWFASMRRAGPVPRTVFWPVPRVESALVAFTRHEPPVPGVAAADLFAVIDTAFAQRRKMLRSAFSKSKYASSVGQAETILYRAGVDPSARAESLTVEQFAAIAQAASQPG
ncbi:MAG TPA: 16S rRNA (adenine(1518)-N(6)/adenine(1519)-N(6))-dimethyltransferase RsmA [Streptosporangiaceae bacterium]